MHGVYSFHIFLFSDNDWSIVFFTIVKIEIDRSLKWKGLSRFNACLIVSISVIILPNAQNWSKILSSWFSEIFDLIYSKFSEKKVFQNFRVNSLQNFGWIYLNFSLIFFPDERMRLIQNFGLNPKNVVKKILNLSEFFFANFHSYFSQIFGKNAWHFYPKIKGKLRVIMLLKNQWIIEFPLIDMIIPTLGWIPDSKKHEHTHWRMLHKFGMFFLPDFCSRHL